MEYLQAVSDMVWEPSSDDLVQCQILSGHIMVNLLLLATINRLPAPKNPRIEVQIGSLLVAIVGTMAWLGYLDTLYPDLHPITVMLKGVAGVGTASLSDTYWSGMRDISVAEYIEGLSGGLAGGILSQAFVHAHFGKYTYVINDFYTPWSIATIYLQAISFLAGIAVFGDTLYCPFHRLAHIPALYPRSHKVHHKYVEHICMSISSVGEFFDQFLSFTFGAAAGHVLYMYVLAYFGLEMKALSTMGVYLWGITLQMSHASRSELAKCIIPFIDERYNFITYHRQHHLNPKANLGGSAITDKLWDAILGQTTTIQSGAPSKADILAARELHGLSNLKDN